MSTDRTACFIGHREIDKTEKLTEQLRKVICRLIVEEKVDVFLFGSKSRFNDLCHDLVTEIKKQYPHIKRVYVRAEYPYISDGYKAYLLKNYEDTYYPEKILGAGRASYVERNYEMIDRSCYCVIYYRPDYAPSSGKSGTRLALEYAEKKKKIIFKFPTF